MNPAIRELVSERANGLCEYCRIPFLWSNDLFDVEHIRPKKHGGTDDLNNLAWSCSSCNAYKAAAVEATDPLTGEFAPFFHPRNDRWQDHFAWSEDSLFIRGLTPTGRAVAERLHVNREQIINLRSALVAVGVHPPTDLWNDII